MNAIPIKTKSIETTPARTVEFNELSWQTIDDPFNRKLTIVVNQTVAFDIAGEGYDSLGQWTDESIKAEIVARYGLEVVG
jgi:hypothetical protein